jgi:2-(1,2-epoxy-1,2-dihydrophenyl)acetyl-CoA isomerase
VWRLVTIGRCANQAKRLQFAATTAYAVGMSDTPNGTVRYALIEGVATITLDRPDSLNSMNEALMRDLRAALGFVDDDERVRVVVLTGAGRGFCSGADLTTVTALDKADGATVTKIMDGAFHPAIRALIDCPVPTVARVHGVTAGGGLGLALACDIAIAAESAVFLAPFGPRLGVVPDLGTTWNLPRRIGRARALGMAMLGERIEARQAEQWGLIWKAVHDDKLDAEIAHVTDALRRTSPAAMKRTRASIDGSFERSLSEQLDIEMGHQAFLIPRNMTEAARAFLEKREPEFGPERSDVCGE